MRQYPNNGSRITINDHGKNVYWGVFTAMAISTICFGLMSIKVPRHLQIFHWITIGITTTASVAYYAMAHEVGQLYVAAYAVPGANREVFFARYVDWCITTPLLLLDLALLAGMPFIDIFLVILADLGMILTGLFGAMDPDTHYRFGFFAFGCIFYFYILWVLVYSARKLAYQRSSRVGHVFTAISLWTILLWSLYPICWGLAEGGNVITPDAEAAFYGTLDILAKCFFGFGLLIAHMMFPESGIALTGSWIGTNYVQEQMQNSSSGSGSKHMESGYDGGNGVSHHNGGGVNGGNGGVASGNTAQEMNSAAGTGTGTGTGTSGMAGHAGDHAATSGPTA